MLRAAGCVLLFYSLLRGLRSPNLWAATHGLFNYDHGFMRRGLLGAVLRLIDAPIVYTYAFFFWLSAALLAANIALLVVLAAGHFRSRPAAPAWATLVYFSGMGVVFMAHTIGYFDQAGLLLALVALAVRDFRLRYALVAIGFSLLILVHETAFVTFGPVLCFILALDASRAATPGRMRAVAALAAWLTLEVVLVGRSSLSPAAAQDMFAALQARADFLLRRDAFDVLTRSFADNVAATFAMWHDASFVAAFRQSALVALPSIVFILGVAVHALAAGRRDRRLWVGACVAGLSPLALHLVGWDCVRWNTLAITTSFVVLLAVTRAAGHREADARGTRGSPALAIVAVPLVVLNLVTGVTLFDNREVQSFPFRDHVDYVRDAWAGRAAFPPRPTHD
jgi:hypothetical protein